MSEEICKNCKYHFIEEISFDYPQSCCNKENIIETTEPLLHCKDFEYSKDYITNLQQENKHLNLQLDQSLNEYEELLIKIDKAIEYIKENACYDKDVKKCCDDLNYNECDELLKILGDKENE